MVSTGGASDEERRWNLVLCGLPPFDGCEVMACSGLPEERATIFELRRILQAVHSQFF